jgi:heme O synthase-like polyprenyltransferase
MRKTTLFIIGFCAGACACLLVVLALGVLFNLLSIQLYASEADQQRNFNLFLIASFIFGSVGGFFALKRFAR